MQFLKYINSLPFTLTIKHVFPFDKKNVQLQNGVLDSAESWDALRISHPHFSISENREEWLKSCRVEIKKDGQDGGLVSRANDVTKVINRLGVTHISSVGVGGAGIEYNIKSLLPNIHMTCSEYSLVSVEILKKVFTECESIIPFDMKDGDWKLLLGDISPSKHLLLINRVEVNFTDKELRKMFQEIHDAKIENVLIVVSGVITARGLLNRLTRRLKWRLSGKSYVFAGYLRTKQTYHIFWDGLYESEEINLTGLPGFLLKKI